MYQLTSRPTESSPSTFSAGAKRGTPAGRIAHVGLAVTVCAALGVGILTGSRAASSHHTVVSAPAHLVAQSFTPDITGGPGGH